MKPLNPGNIYTFYLSKKWQFHRQPGTDLVPFGLIAPAERLIPFQFYSASGASPTVSWDLVDPADDSTVHALSSGQLSIDNKDGGGFWVTWPATSDLSSVPPCGYWQIRLTVNGTEYWGNVLHLRGTCGSESGSLSTDNCAISDDLGHLEVDLIATISAIPGYSYAIQRYNGSSWVTVSTDAGYTTFDDLDDESEQYRLVITTACGWTLTYTYSLTWTNGEDPCGTLAFSLTGTSIVEGSESLDTQWRIRFGNDNDRGTVYYTGGYQQYFYPEALVFDVPQIERQEDVKKNLEGVETTRYAKTKVKQVFEVPNIPDYCIGFFAQCGDLNSIVLETVDGDTSETLTGVEFSTRRQNSGFSVGIFTFVSETGIERCQPDFELA